MLVDTIYSSAVEPRRFEHLIDNWDMRLRAAGYAGDAMARLNGSDIVDHFVKAHEAEALISQLREKSLPEAAVSRIDTAALVCSAEGRLLACNAAAARAFSGAVPGATIAELPLTPAGIAQFRESIAHVASASDGRHEILRLRHEPGNRPVYAFVRPLRDGPRTHVLIVTTEHVWQPEVEKALQRAFVFTAAEVNVLRMIMSGKPATEIAEALGRSEATIRSQIHGLLSKSGTRSQAELMSLTLAFQDSADEDALATRTVRRPGATAVNPYETLVLPDGRGLDHLRLGDPAGRPFLWLHGNLAQCRLPQSAEQWLHDNRILMVVPIRAGYGYSSPLPPGRNALETAIHDIAQLRSYLGLTPGPVVAHCNDFLLACRLALANPKAITRIFGIGAAFAIETPEEYARLNKWARFFRANARHAPRVLAYLGRGGYTMVRRIGFENYVEMVLRGSPDAAAIGDPEIRAAVLAGMDINWGDDVRAHEAFAADTIAVHRDPWPDLSRLPVPVTLIHGMLDQNASYLSAAEQSRLHRWPLTSIPDAGSLIHHSHWRDVFGAVAADIAAAAR
jgi:pimeloyl-ACP methyl ester carboxylesterase/DNA-binding CsgD family transcriptional regulator